MIYEKQEYLLNKSNVESSTLFDKVTVVKIFGYQVSYKSVVLVVT